MQSLTGLYLANFGGPSSTPSSVSPLVLSSSQYHGFIICLCDVCFIIYPLLLHYTLTVPLEYHSYLRLRIPTFQIYGNRRGLVCHNCLKEVNKTFA